LLKIRILAIGKDKDRWVEDGCKHYLKQLGKYARVEMVLLPALKSAGSLPHAEIMSREAEKLQKAIGNEYLVALSDHGQKTDSRAFAGILEDLTTVSGGSVVFLIGGPYGIHERMLSRADMVLSLSPLTFSHQLVRLVLLEQLYRGFDILRGGSYHK
jgi:23S rRNA (pseudouridine1915-N3)-methyltransferase